MTDGLYIGLMSGTSMDGIDAALVEITEQQNRLLESHLHPWPDELRRTLAQAVQQQRCSLEDLGTLDARCGEIFAAAALAVMKKADVAATQVIAIGSHGQTLHHGPEHLTPYSMQIGDPNRITGITGITTVADFRRRDIAAGGQGAPLVPAFHQKLFADQNHNRVILNIGGIANITLLPAQGKSVSGFDTGPGNCLLDRWASEHLHKTYDANGDWSATGSVIPELLEKLLSDKYFALAPPKSTGTEYFSRQWLQQHIDAMASPDPADVQATLRACSANSIANAISAYSPEVTEILVCGGGVHNEHLMTEIQRALPTTPVRSTREYGVDPDWIEAMAFAWLARQTLEKQPGNLPAVTGAQKPSILGGIYYA